MKIKKSGFAIAFGILVGLLASQPRASASLTCSELFNVRPSRDLVSVGQERQSMLLPPLPRNAIVSDTTGVAHLQITPDGRYAFVKHHQTIRDFGAKMDGIDRPLWQFVDLLTGESRWLDSVPTPPADKFGAARSDNSVFFVKDQVFIQQKDGLGFYSLHRFSLDGRPMGKPIVKNGGPDEYVQSMIREESQWKAGNGDRVVVSSDSKSDRVTVLKRDSGLIVAEIPREANSFVPIGDEHFASWNDKANEMRVYNKKGDVAFRVTKEQFYSSVPLKTRVAARLIGFESLIKDFTPRGFEISKVGRTPSVIFRFETEKPIRKQFLFSIDETGKFALEVETEPSLGGVWRDIAVTATGLNAVVYSKDGKSNVLHLGNPRTGLKRDIQLNDLQKFDQTESYLMVHHGSSLHKQARVIRFFDNSGQPLKEFEIKPPSGYGNLIRNDIELLFETGNGAVIVQFQNDPGHYMLNPLTGKMERREGQILHTYNDEQSRNLPMASQKYGLMVVADLNGSIYAGSWSHPRIVDFDGNVVRPLDDVDFSKGIGRVEFPAANRALIISSKPDGPKRGWSLRQISW